MFDVQRTQLPTTATPLAKAMDILEERLFSLPVQMISKDPWTTDAAWLDHLAWEHSVDVWDAGWPEEVKRRVVAASAEVHRYKGTPHAIKAVLAALGLPGDVVEWWQAGGNGVPGTFAVQADIADADGVLPDFGPDLLRMLVDLVRGAAPVSRFFEVNLHYGLKGNLPLACVASFGARVHVQPYVETSLSETATLPVAVVIAANARLEINGAV
ncbi:phage tail protein I [Leisingera sp. HS039]|uniref:phage tail protein I n=1 Tax=Leisingera sp. HS039 TaxID=2818496 RepID=UPI001B3A2641|nr:phage tail protein I [Leisingera sp. HS039]MBQ4826554.1 phage tail protein I [Leisingera sp. HS039]